MADKKKEVVVVKAIKEIQKDIFDLTIQTDKMAALAKAGQFVSLYCADGSRLLPRPISICGIDAKEGTLRLVFRIAGEGTREFSKLQPGDTIRAVGPLGNGFPLLDKKAFLIGGGIGIPPMLELAKQLTCDKTVILGYRDNAMFLKDEFEELAPVYVATEDGSAGTKGNVLDAIRKQALEADVIYACGPLPMLRALKEYARENNIICYVSLEERMACGIGACLGCVCKSKDKDEHSHVNNKRICKEGPVFLAEEVDF